MGKGKPVPLKVWTLLNAPFLLCLPLLQPNEWPQTAEYANFNQGVQQLCLITGNRRLFSDHSSKTGKSLLWLSSVLAGQRNKKGKQNSPKPVTPTEKVSFLLQKCSKLTFSSLLRLKTAIHSPFYAILWGQMRAAKAEKPELMLALYIFMTFGVFTEYRSYCLEYFLTLLRRTELGKRIMNSSLFVHEYQSQHLHNAGLLTPKPT